MPKERTFKQIMTEFKPELCKPTARKSLREQVEIAIWNAWIQYGIDTWDETKPKGFYGSMCDYAWTQEARDAWYKHHAKTLKKMWARERNWLCFSLPCDLEREKELNEPK